jgi:peptidoglycan/xylan/chitin deacetylase (PgdA/CDA1 family)
MPADGVDILMYHSISEGPGPLSISPSIFRMQMQTLADCGFRGVSLSDYISIRQRQSPVSGKTVVLTFDDGFADFADVVFPDLHDRGWRCTVFVAAALIDRYRDTGWDPDGSGIARPLLSWKEIQRLSGCGVEFGSHGLSHVDLTRVPSGTASGEIIDGKRDLEDRVRSSVTSFAPPFGRSTPGIRRQVAQHYRCSVGTTLARASEASDPFDLPRIEMWYFRDPARWRRYVSRGPTGYFAVRRFFRAIRRAGVTRLA